MINTLCAVWETAALAEPVSTLVHCRTVITLAGADDTPRFAYVSAGSPIEQLTGEGSTITDAGGTQLAVTDLVTRLLDGDVAGVLAPKGPAASAKDSLVLPEHFLERRQKIRNANVLARFLIRQIGLEEVSSHRGAPEALYTEIAKLWSLDLALCTDPAMLLTLGADRQRYVDQRYNQRATDRLPRALGRLHDLGVRSYPRLVIV